MIHARNIYFSYPSLQHEGTPHKVFSRLSLDLEEGGFLAVMGKNGSGKSTLGYIVAGLAPRHTGGQLSGELRVTGEDLQANPPSTGRIGLLFQDSAPQLFNTTVAYEVAWGLEAMGLSPEKISERVEEALALFGMTAHADHPPWTLSGGEQKRCALASIWAMNPRLLVLDEPLNGLDIGGRASLISAIQALQHEGATALVMTHQQQAAHMAENVIFLADGTASAKLPSKEVFTQQQWLIETGLAYPPSLWPELHKGIDQSPHQPAVEIHHLQYDYPGGRRALQHINLVIPHGQFVAIVGPNGAGKSTLARHLNGLLHPSQGEVRIMGKKTTGYPTGEFARDVGFLFQRPEQQLFAPTVRDEIAYGPRNLGMVDVENQVTRVLDRFNLSEYADLPPAILSYGTQRTVTLASLAVMNTPVLVLDEPTVGLDGIGWRQLISWLAELRKSDITIILITHEMALAAQADRVLVMDKGTITADGQPSTTLPQTTQGT